MLCVALSCSIRTGRLYEEDYGTNVSVNNIWVTAWAVKAVDRVFSYYSKQLAIYKIIDSNITDQNQATKETGLLMKYWGEKKRGKAR